MTTETVLSQPSFLKKKLAFGITPATLILIAIIILSLGLHLYNIQAIGDANAYYTAAVESMTQSWSNFFFVAAEPGGSVTVDKPPLGLWIEALFAYFLGVSGFTTSLPNILAGVVSIPILYMLVKKYAGELAGLVAAFVVAVTPVYLATNRNNTMDGMLVFFLLLAAWAFVHATETGKLRWVLLGAFIVGLGFNIKMAQAFLPLPAFYALYFLGSKAGWLRKALNLGAATVLLIAVSLSWAVVVDLVPADSRPYIGSSHDNSVISLMLEHNGGSRLVGGGGPQGGQNPPPQDGARQGPPPEALAACANLSQGAECSFQGRDRTVNGTCIMPPNLDQLACAPQGMIPPQNGQAPQAPNGQPPMGGPGGQGGAPFSQETGEAGALRFFTNPLSKQMSWLLPFALISVVLALFGSKIQLPIESGVHKALILWGGWLLTCIVFFSMISGIFHSYYAIMLVPPLGAMVGIGFAQLWAWSVDRKWVSALWVGSALITLAFQVFATYQYGEKSLWMFAAAILFGLGVMLMELQKRAAYVLILAAMLVIPAYWTIKTVTSTADHNLPTAYAGGNAAQNGNDRARAGNPPRQSNVNEKLLAELQANTQGMKYLVAVPSSQQGAQMVIATGRPVLYMGGFSGMDDVVSVDDLKTLIANGELRYILYGGGRGNKEEISNWLQTACVNMPGFAQTDNRPQPPNAPQGSGDQQMFLYRCE